MPGANSQYGVAIGGSFRSSHKRLAGENSAASHAARYWRFGRQKAIRKGQWKLVDWRDHDAKQDSGWQLYDLAKNLGEARDVAAANPQIRAELRRDWEVGNAQNLVPLWHGGADEDPTAPTATDRRKTAALTGAG